MKTLFGILLFALGLYLIYQSFELKDTYTAKAEREISTAINYFSKNKSAKLLGKINTEADIKLLIGGFISLIGLLLIILGIKSNKRSIESRFNNG